MLKRLGLQVRKGARIRGLPLPLRDTAIVFTLSSGQQIEVDLHETAGGGLLIRSHSGKLAVSAEGDTYEVRVAAQTGVRVTDQ